MDLDKYCPRCNSAWKVSDFKKHYYCGDLKCGMSYDVLFNYLYMYVKLGNSSFCLEWELDSNDCIIVNDKTGEEIKLPWLDYKIEISKIEKYIIFI